MDMAIDNELPNFINFPENPVETYGGCDMVDIEDDKNDTQSVFSITSTARYSHEAFKTFQEKVMQLATEVFLEGSCFEISRMKGGSFNRIVGLKVVEPSPKKYTWKWMCELVQSLFGNHVARDAHEYIVRVPRYVITNIEYDVATLLVIGSRLSIPIPRVTFADLTDKNVLGNPYMIQPRLVGENLAFIWDSLNLAQKKSAAREITKLLVNVASVTSNAAGTVSLSHATITDASTIALDKFSVPCRGQEVDKYDKPFTSLASSQTTLEFLLEQCERWREFQTAEGICWHNIWDGLTEVARGLNELGFLDETFHLCHGDLLPYNMLVEVCDDKNIEITAILDWDSAFFAPTFVAYRPPFWMWLDEDDNGDNEAGANVDPQTEENIALKAAFNETATTELKRFAYAPEYILARKMFNTLKNGLFATWDIEAAEDVIHEWGELHPDQDSDSRTDSSWNSGVDQIAGRA